MWVIAHFLFLKREIDLLCHMDPKLVLLRAWYSLIPLLKEEPNWNSLLLRLHRISFLGSDRCKTQTDYLLLGEFSILRASFHTLA